MNKRNLLIKIGKICICMFLIINFLSYCNVFAEINDNYVEYTLTTNNENSNNILSVITDIVLPVVLPVFTIIESLTAGLMDAVTDIRFFPWADLIVYNSIPLLDINFINPAKGSLFMDKYGNETAIGEMVRNTYFTILSICIAFLTIAVGINVIKMLLSDIGGQKAKYKMMINKTVITLVLLFGMHYLISFVFYLNEQLVEVASGLTTTIIGSSQANSAIEVMNEASDKDNSKIVANFFDDADHTSLTPITVAKKVVKELINAGHAIWESVKGLFKDWKKAKDGDKVDVDRDERGNEPFPSKKDYINKISKLDHGIDVASYLIKDYHYRDKRLWSVKGNDANKFSQTGIWGPLRSVGNTVMWVTGIVDTGLVGLQNLYNDVYFVTVDMKNNNIVPSAKRYTEIATYYTNIINDKSESEEDRENAKLALLFVSAYYRYVYDGEDKADTGVSNVVSNLGNFFKRNIYYTDVDKGDWSPSTFNAVSCILYCMFILQSMMFLFSYVKRLFYVIILALIGPVTVIYDYVMQSL